MSKDELPIFWDLQSFLQLINCNYDFNYEFVFLNTTVFSEGDDYDSENGNEDYRTGKELAYDGNYKAAIVYLKKSIRDDPNNPDAFNMLGFSNRKLGNNDEAFSYYNKALGLNPEHLGTHEYIGRLYLNLDQPEESKKHFRILNNSTNAL